MSIFVLMVGWLDSNELERQRKEIFMACFKISLVSRYLPGGQDNDGCSIIVTALLCSASRISAILYQGLSEQVLVQDSEAFPGSEKNIR
jgi:hypothetical protein